LVSDWKRIETAYDKGRNGYVEYAPKMLRLDAAIKARTAETSWMRCRIRLLVMIPVYRRPAKAIT
jgi:hypothetical protein